MNGRPSPAGQRWATGKAVDQPRLAAALLVSCLLHLAALGLPALGERNPGYRLALKGEQKMPYFLNATLVVQGKHRFSAEALRAEGENVPHASIPYRSEGRQLRPEQPAASGAGLLPIESQAFYSPDQLSKRPQPLAKAELDPPDLNPIVASGKLVLNLWIDAGGKVTRIEIDSNNLPPKFVRTALIAFEQMRFVPGERDGRAVGTVLKIEVNYEDGRVLPDDGRVPQGDGRSPSK